MSKNINFPIVIFISLCYILETCFGIKIVRFASACLEEKPYANIFRVLVANRYEGLL